MPCSRGCCPSQRDHYRSVSFGTSAEARRIDERERQWARDHAAYRRLRADGLQPKSLDGAAAVEARADLPVEVEMGKVAFTSKGRASLRAGVELSGELGLTG